MSVFSDIPKAISSWVGVPGLIATLIITLAVWLYYDLIVEMTLNNTMTFGVGICSLLFVALIKIVAGLFRPSSKTKDDEPNDK